MSIVDRVLDVTLGSFVCKSRRANAVMLQGSPESDVSRELWPGPH